ncbi:phosphorylase family protein [Toxoplasma gondii RUB]|uniref:Phosphorylase family protein n=1 Tax=Toxoplasma gondii RUB TaxID=935652 RepID=A0A086LN25_TOXGO|nr:phosphorylase family protein [Toxoplasma gondii RUB]
MPGRVEIDYQSCGSSSHTERPRSRTSPHSLLVRNIVKQHAPHPRITYPFERHVPSASVYSSLGGTTNMETHSTYSLTGGSYFLAEGSAKRERRSSSGSQITAELSSSSFETGDGGGLSFPNACMGAARSDTAQTKMSNTSSHRRSELPSFLTRTKEGASLRQRGQLAHDGESFPRDEKRPMFSGKIDADGMAESVASFEDTTLSRHSIGNRAAVSSSSVIRNSRRTRETTNETPTLLSSTGTGTQYPVPHAEDLSTSISSNASRHSPPTTSAQDVLSSGGRNAMDRVSSRQIELRAAALEANPEFSLSGHDSKRNFCTSTGTSSFRSALGGGLGYDEKQAGREREEGSPRASTVTSVLTECQDDMIRGRNSTGGRNTRRGSYDSGVERDMARGTSGARITNSSREKTTDKEVIRLPERRRSTREDDIQLDLEASTSSKDRGMYPDESKVDLRHALLLPSGHVYHLGVRRGDVYPRILTVGHTARADFLADSLLEAKRSRLSLTSSRFFKVHSGYYKGTKVSIIATGMGAPMIELLMREVSYITDGPLAVVRLGTCSLLNPRLRPGCLVVATKGVMGCYNDYTFFDGSMEDGACLKGVSPYVITRPCAPDHELSNRIVENISKAVDDPSLLHLGLHASAENFYACQGHVDNLFNDRNEKLIDQLLSHGVDSMDMESHQLLHLANRRFKPVKAAAAHIGISHRTNDQFAHPITAEVLNERVLLGGRACLDALVSVQM